MEPQLSLGLPLQEPRDHLANDAIQGRAKRPCYDSHKFCFPTRGTTDLFGDVPRIHVDAISKTRFREAFMSQNRPVILTGIGKDWRAFADWRNEDGSIAVGSLERHFGDDVVSIIDANRRSLSMSVKEYVQWWRTRTSEGSTREYLYLKDWTLAAAHEDYKAYESPPQLSDDWLNEHWACLAGGEGGARRRQVVGDDDAKHTAADTTNNSTRSGFACGDHRFVYLGPKGSSTSLHADVFFSYSWSINVSGRKRWHLVPDAQRHLVSDAATEPIVKDVRTLPHVRAIVVEQDAGEALFVPSGWYHQVENMTDCLSINHNWLNACNAHWPVVRLTETCEAIRSHLGEESSDPVLCMQMLQRRCGVDVLEYVQILSGVVSRRRGRLATHARAARPTRACVVRRQSDAGAHPKTRTETKTETGAETGAVVPGLLRDVRAACAAMQAAIGYLEKTFDVRDFDPCQCKALRSYTSQARRAVRMATSFMQAGQTAYFTGRDTTE